MFFTECNFIFFMTLFLKEMGIVLRKSKSHYHSRVGKPIFKILSIYWKNVVGKQLSQAICSKYVFSLLHAPKFQIFYKVKYDGRSCQTVQRYSMKKLLWWILLENTYAGVSFLINFLACRLKKDSCAVVSCEFYQIFQNAFLQNSSGWLLLLNTHFCSLRRPQSQKLFPSTLVI